MDKTYTFHVKGMHCPACVVLTESELKEVPEVSGAKASLKDLNVQVTGSFGDKAPEHVAKDLSQVLKPHGYTLELQKQKGSAKWREFASALPLVIGFITFFVTLQKLGVVNLITTSQVTYPTAFLIGIVASLSTCMAVVGSLTLSVSANFAKEGDKVRPQVLFHAGRLASFFLLGGVIGAFGAVFKLGIAGTFFLNIVIALVLLVLGINLLDVFSWAKKLQLTLPKFIGKQAYGLKYANHTLTPLLLGIATFFLPCGFTQSMQIYTLTTGSFLVGGITMLSFALGTLPVLSLLSFTSLSIQRKDQLGIFFKTAGLVIIFFSIINLLNAFVAAGFISPLFSF